MDTRQEGSGDSTKEEQQTAKPVDLSENVLECFVDLMCSDLNQPVYLPGYRVTW